MALNGYIAQVQRLLGTGSGGNLYSTADITTYINQARNQIAAEGQCIRVFPPISGPITAITVSSSGSGYAGTVQVTVGPPDSPSGLSSSPNGLRATATVVLGANSGISSISVSNSGTGYFQPLITLSSIGGGTGAVLVATVSGINTTIAGQEVYPFSAVNPLVSGNGVQSIFMVNSIALLWGNSRIVLNHVSFSRYQAQYRQYSANQYQFIPGVFSQFGQGGAGSVYCYPVPNSQYQWEWDACALPIPLGNDTDIEAIPYPWTDAIPFLAAYFALSGSQRTTDADRMWNEFQKFIKRARQFSQPRATVSPYGRAW